MTLDPLRSGSRVAGIRRAVRSPSNRASAAAGLLALVILVALDLIAGMTVSISSAFAVAPLIAAYFGGFAGVLLVALASIALAALSPLWNQSDFGTLQTVRLAIVAISGAIALVTAWVTARARVTNDRMRLLESVGRVADGGAPLPATLERIVDILVPRIADFCMIDIFREGVPARVAARVHGAADGPSTERWLRSRRPAPPREIVEPGHGRIPEARLFTVFDERESERASHGDPEEMERIREMNVRSTIYLPLVTRGRTLGALTLGTAWSGRRYGEEELRFAEVMAGRVGLVLDNAGLFSDLASVESRLATVMRSLSEGVMVVDRDATVVYANPAAADWLGFEDEDELVASGPAELHGRLRVFEESGRELHEPLAELAEAIGGRRMLRVLTQGDRSERWARFSVEPVEGSETTDHAVIAIEEMTEVKRAEIAQRFLASAGELLAQAGEGDVLQRLTDLGAGTFADVCSVSVPDGDQMRYVALSGSSPEHMASAELLARNYPASAVKGRIARVVATGEGELLDLPEEALRRSATSAAHFEAMRDAGVRSAIVVPIISGTRNLGVLGFINAQRSRRFDEQDLAVATEIGRRAGAALETARLSGEIAKVAQTLQRELLPPALPEIRGWSLQAIYEPAGEVSYVGGDFYDVLETPEGWWVVIGDVVGRGASAASLTAVARSTLRSSAIVSGDPVTALETLDRVMRERRPKPGVCSVALIGLPKEATGARPVPVAITVAGHPLPLHILSGGTVREVGSFGPLIGAFRGSRWQSERLELAVGDELLLYTDGITEAKRAEGDRYGEDRLVAELEEGGSQGSIERVLESLSKFGAMSGADDMAMLTVHRVDENEERPESRFKGLRTGGDAEPSESLTRAAGDG